MSLALSPEQFLTMAERAAHIAADHLASLDGRPIAPTASGAEAERLFAGEAPEVGEGASALEGLAAVAAADFVARVLNQNVTAWRSSPGVTIERTVVRWLACAVGCDGFTGSLTGGGSPAGAKLT